MNGLTIGVIAFLVLMTLAGMYNGLIRCIFGMAAFILSAAVSFVGTKLFSAALKKGSMADVIFFIAAFLVIYIAIMVVAISLDLLASLPVISTLNKVGGAILGAALGLLCVWVAMAVIAVLAHNGSAGQILDMIEESPLLGGLYDNNLIDLFLQENLWSEIGSHQ